MSSATKLPALSQPYNDDPRFLDMKRMGPLQPSNSELDAARKKASMMAPKMGKLGGKTRRRKGKKSRKTQKRR
jgi:hypothetical protein